MEGKRQHVELCTPVFLILDVRDVSPVQLLASVPLVPLLRPLGPAGTPREPGRPAVQAVPWVVVVGVGHAADHTGRGVLVAEDRATCRETKTGSQHEDLALTYPRPFYILMCKTRKRRRPTGQGG